MAASLTDKILTLEDLSNVEQELTFEQIAKVTISRPGEGNTSSNVTGSNIRRVGEIFFVGLGSVSGGNGPHINYYFPASGTYGGAYKMGYASGNQSATSFSVSGGSSMANFSGNAEGSRIICAVRTS